MKQTTVKSIMSITAQALDKGVTFDIGHDGRHFTGNIFLEGIVINSFSGYKTAWDALTETLIGVEAITDILPDKKAVIEEDVTDLELVRVRKVR